MPPDSHTAPEQDTISLTRIPIFDDKHRLWGYELFCFGKAMGSATSEDQEGVGLCVANSAYIGMQYIFSRGKKIMVHHSEAGILENLPYALPADSAIVMVNPSIVSNPDALNMLKRLKADKFIIAIGDFAGDSACAEVYPMADIICISVNGRRKDELMALISAAEPYKAKFMAMDLQTPDQFDMCREVGFVYFTGSFFKKTDVIQLRKMSSNEAARFKLLALLEAPDPDLDELVENIESDVSISFRLLAYLNSAAFGFRQKIKSVQQAVTMLGWDKMKNWLRVVLVTDISQHKDTEDLTMLSAQRGKFLELVVASHDYWGFEPDSLHLLGLFSLLDVMLGIPMQDIVAHLPLDDKLKAALCGDENNEYVQLLQLARLFEEARWADAERMVQQLGLDPAKVKSAFQTAVEWAGELTRMYAAPATMA